MWGTIRLFNLNNKFNQRNLDLRASLSLFDSFQKSISGKEGGKKVENGFQSTK